MPIKPQVQTDSTYRRIQAFFEKFTPDYEDLSRFRYGLNQLREIPLNAWRMRDQQRRCVQALVDPLPYLPTRIRLKITV